MMAGNFTRTNPLLFSLSLLLLSSAPIRISVEGSRHLAGVNLKDAQGVEGDEEMVVVAGAMIGSRPPSCAGRCSTCGHCEAVQVPLSPQEKRRREEAAAVATSGYRGDEYSSNYKPMNWKCKCGGLILNP